MIRRDILESQINELYEKLNDLKKDYSKENSSYIEHKCFSLASRLEDMPRENSLEYKACERRLRHILQELDQVNLTYKEKEIKKQEKRENKTTVEKRKNLNNLRLRNKKLRNLKINLVKLSLVIGGVLLIKKGVDSYASSLENKQYVNNIVYGEDNFNDPAAIKYFEEVGINKKNIVKDKVCYHLVCEENSENANEIATLYRNKANKTGIKNVDIMSIKDVEDKLDRWKSQNDSIKDYMETTSLDYDQVLKLYFKNDTREEEFDLDKEHIFLYLKDSKETTISKNGTLFDDLTEASLLRNKINVKLLEDYSLLDKLNSVDDRLSGSFEYKVYEDENGNKERKSIDVESVDSSFITLGIKENINEEEKETIASSLLESTVMYNLKGSKVNDSSTPQLITDYDKVKFEIDSHKKR